MRGRSSNRPKAIRVFIAWPRSFAIRNASSASSRGMVCVITGFTSMSPDRINLTAVANSSWNRSEPRRSSSFAVICIIGTVMSPPSPNCTTTPRGRIAAIPPDSARAVPVHSYSTSKYPLPAAKASSASGVPATSIVRSAPADAACSRALRTRSVATISAAPARRAAMIASTPIGPQPVTSTCLPSSSPARRVAWMPTDNGSAIAASAADSPFARTHWAASAISSSRNAP